MSRRLVLAAPLAAPFAIGGCALGPVYRAPDLEIPDTYRADGADRPAIWPQTSWWRGFGSPELDALIAAAQAGNFDLAGAIARVREADAQLRVAGAGLLPTFGLSGDADWRHTAQSRRSGSTLVPTGRYADTRSFSLVPAISWELDLWGRIAAGRDAATANLEASLSDARSVALSVVTAVAATWFQALAQQDRVDVAGRNLADAEAIGRAIAARAQAGTASQLDVSQQGALAAGLRAQIPGLRNQLEQQVNALGVLTGRPPSAILVRPGTLAALSLPEIAPGLPSELLARRPDVAAAEAQLRAANANIRVARTNFFPSLSLTGSAGWQNLALATLFGPGSLFASATAAVTQSIFDNGLRRGQFDLARARYDELLAAYRKAVVQAFTDVENAVQAWHFTTEQESLQRAAVAIAQRAADIARAQLQAGTVDLVNALQAQTTLFNALDLLAQVRLARFQALLALYKAVGGGWSAPERDALVL